MAFDRSIVDRIVSRYRNPHNNYYFRLHDGFLSLEDLLDHLIPGLRTTNWPFEKREISRIWHQLILVPKGRRPEEFRHLLPRPRCTNQCTQLPTDAAYVTDGLINVPVQRPTNSGLQGTQAISSKRATHKVLISTFWNEWFMATDSYIKHYNVVRESKLSTLLVCQTDVGESNVRYSVTLMPHYHDSAQSVDDNLLAIPSEELQKRIICKGSAVPSKDMVVSFIVMNSKEATIHSLRSLIANIRRVENPMMMLVTHTRISGTDAVNATQTLGFPGVITSNANESKNGGMWLLWNPRWVKIDQYSFYNRCINVTVEPASEFESCAGTTYFIRG